MMKRVAVVAGILIDEHNRILLAKRAASQHQGDKWEFPGGKIESNESPEQALCRELLEELDIITAPEDCQPFKYLHFDYPDKQVSLHFFCIRHWQRTPKGMENQPLQWVPISESSQYELPAANQTVMDALIKHLSA